MNGRHGLGGNFYPFSHYNDWYQPAIQPRVISAQDIHIPVVAAALFAGVLLSSAFTSTFQARARQQELEANNSTCADCIFPFYFENSMVTYTSCIILDINNKTVCPTRNITTKIMETNSFNIQDVFHAVSENISNPATFGYCPEDVGIPNSPLSREKQDCEVEERIRPFEDCPNACTGLFFWGPALAGLGGLGAAGTGGGAGIGQVQCSGPFFCRDRRGQCCLLVFTLNGLGCPDECPPR